MYCLQIFMYIYFCMNLMGRRKMEKMGSKVARFILLPPPPRVKFSLQNNFVRDDFRVGNRPFGVCIPSRVLRTLK